MAEDIDATIDLDPAPQPDNQDGAAPPLDNQAPEPDEPVDLDAEPDEGGDEPPEPVDEEEFELDGGLKVRGPKALKDHILRQADYTRKTQEVAELRRTLEADRASITALKETDKALQTDLARLAHIDDQLAAVGHAPNGQPLAANQIDWIAWQQQNPQAANAALQRVNVLNQQRAALQARVDEGKRTFESEASKLRQERLRATQAFAEKEIPNWSPERDNAIGELVKNLGLSQGATKALEANMEPGLLKALDLALDGLRYREAVAKRGKAAPAASNVTPIKQVGRRSAGPATRRPEDITDMDGYVAARQRQLKQASRGA